jgi:trehalose 6-phosphate synthase
MLESSVVEVASPQERFAALEATLLANRHLVVVSNRGPVTFEFDIDGTPKYQRGTGGLVTALLGLLHHVDATWIACARTEADAVWKEGDVTFGENQNSLRVIFLNPDPPVYEGYYNVIANPLLWFLQHSLWDLSRHPIIDRSTWDAWEGGYQQMNRLFAEAITDRVAVKGHRQIIMLQDYHLYLAARYVRDRLSPRRMPTMMHFTHIPWPGPEYWRILPPGMRGSILDGMCAVDLLGFQTREDGLNFLRSCEAYLPEAHVSYRRGWVWHRNHVSYVRDFPISIDVSSVKGISQDDAISEYYKELKDIVGDRQLILRIDRIEPSKNITRGFIAFEEMLQFHPEHIGKVVFLAMLVPSRMEVSEYQDYQDSLMAYAGRVNSRFGNSEWEPVRILIGDNYPRAIAALKLYDALLVNSLADGMNLVAKEGPVVNERNGVLVLSERTGARQQLGIGAIVISPCDIYATSEALHQALVMPVEEREERASRMRWVIEREDIVYWISHQLETLQELRLLKK